MALDVTIAVGTYGDREYVDWTYKRPAQCALYQQVPFVHVHGRNLCEARNAALAAVRTEFVCFVDADDEIDRRYFERMELGSADIRVPSVRYVGSGAEAPRVPRVVGHNHLCHAACLAEGNYIVVGAVARTRVLRSVGGFPDYPIYEDWALWVRCWQAGATIETVPGAIYLAQYRQGSRNRAPNPEEKMRVHRWIAADYGLPVPA